VEAHVGSICVDKQTAFWCVGSAGFIIVAMRGSNGQITSERRKPRSWFRPSPLSDSRARHRGVVNTSRRNKIFAKARTLTGSDGSGLMIIILQIMRVRHWFQRLLQLNAAKNHRILVTVICHDGKR